jgi:hypothetical protein
MKRNQFYNSIKIFLFFFHVACLHGEIHIPIDNENEITLRINGQNRTYHELDKGGLSYHHIGSEHEFGDSIKVGIYSRSIKSFKGNKKKKFGFKIQVNDDEPFELTYKKEGSNVTSPDRPGWNYTKSGVWFFYLPVQEDEYEIKIKPLSKKPIIYLRLRSNVIKKKGKFSNVIKSVNHQKRTKIDTKNDNDELDNVSTLWYALDKNKHQQFQIKGPKNVRIFSRISYQNQLLDDYYISIREDGIELGTYYFITEESTKSFIFSSKVPVSKWRSIWLTVPEGIHYYTFSLPDIENNFQHTTFIRIKEWLME